MREPQPAAAPATLEDEAEEQHPDRRPDRPGTPVRSEVARRSESTQLAERTADLQRLQAEYVNYKRRVDRDRALIRRATIEGGAQDLLKVLDDIESAREHDELTGGFKAVAEELERVTGKHGLQTYGEKGDPFDPHIHEALMHVHAGRNRGATCVGDPAARLPDGRPDPPSRAGRPWPSRTRCTGRSCGRA